VAACLAPLDGAIRSGPQCQRCGVDVVRRWPARRRRRQALTLCEAAWGPTHVAPVDPAGARIDAGQGGGRPFGPKVAPLQRKGKAMSNLHEDNEPVPAIQRLLDNPFLLLFVGVLMPTVIYILWGVIDILTIPLAK
jgi:hypothetical protein